MEMKGGISRMGFELKQSENQISEGNTWSKDI